MYKSHASSKQTTNQKKKSKNISNDGKLILEILPLQISSRDNVSLELLAPGDSVSLLCESDQSKPASDLSWAINGAQVRRQEITNRNSPKS